MEEKPVTVAVFANEYELALAKGMLESAGIQCFVLERGYVQLEWLERGERRPPAVASLAGGAGDRERDAARHAV